MSVFKPARSYLNHRILDCDRCPLPSSADKHTHIILTWCSGLAEVKSWHKAALCAHITGMCVLSQQDGIELEKSHTHTYLREKTSWKIRCLMTLHTIFF